MPPTPTIPVADLAAAIRAHGGDASVNDVLKLTRADRVTRTNARVIATHFGVESLKI